MMRDFLFLKSSKEWQEKSAEVRWIRRDGPFYFVFFEDNPSYAYTYYYLNVLEGSEPYTRHDEVELQTKDGSIVGDYSVREYKARGLYMVEFCDGKDAEIYEGPKCKIVNREKKAGEVTPSDVFMHYAKLSKVIEIGDGDDRYVLVGQYRQVSELKGDSAFCKLCNGINPPLDFQYQLIFPFALNSSQCSAVKNAFSHSVSVVEGPPGTGKTETILTIIANAVVANRTVAVCSNNNNATANIMEKLAKHGYGDIVSSLGNSKNIEKFFSVPNDIPKPYPLPESDISISEYDVCLKGFIENEENVKALGRLRSSLAELRDERSRFLSSHSVGDGNPFRVEKTSDEMLKTIASLENGRPSLNYGLLRRLCLYFSSGLKWDVLKKLTEEIAMILRKGYYDKAISEEEAKAKELEEKVSAYDSTGAREKIRAYSRRRLALALNLRYGQSHGRRTFKKDDYKSRFTDFLRRFPIVLSSTYSLRNCSGSGCLYDYLIIDEASQTGMESAMLSLTAAKNIVVVGDSKQLGEINNARAVGEEGRLLKDRKIPECLQYHDNNILKAVKDRFGENVPSVLLEEHYRCESDIIAFSNKRFYSGKLRCMKEGDGKASHLSLIHTVPGNHARRNPSGTGQYNEREISEVMECVNKCESKDIAVIVPYRCQVAKLRERLPENVQVDTIHKFQGRECDDVIFSTVANSGEDYYADDGKELRNFVNRDDLINVAMTRAKEHFTLITSDGIYRKSKGCLGDLVRYLRFQTGVDVSEGKVKSVFDILYGNYANALGQCKGKDIPSENIVMGMLKEIITSNPLFCSIRVMRHVPLGEAISIEESRFTPYELKYLRHPWTHVDFALINTFDKKPLLLIEVDGVRYHEQNMKQRRRDEVKDKAIALSRVPFMRLKTNGDGEKSKVEDMLFSIL